MSNVPRAEAEEARGFCRVQYGFGCMKEARRCNSCRLSKARTLIATSPPWIRVAGNEFNHLARSLRHGKSADFVAAKRFGRLQLTDALSKPIVAPPSEIDA